MARISRWKPIPAQTAGCELGLSAVFKLFRSTFRHSADDETYMESECPKTGLDRLACIGKLYWRPCSAHMGRSGVESGRLCFGELSARTIWVDRCRTMFHNG